MACYNSFLILSYICVLCPFVLPNGTNETNNNIRINDMNTSNARDSNIFVKLRNETLSQSYSECDCGLHSTSCRLNILGKKKCTCEKGYVSLFSYRKLEEECGICDCGTNSTCTVDEKGKKKCTCGPGYVPKMSLPSFQEYCQACDCGKGSISCDLDILNNKQCTCRKGYATYRKKFKYNDESCKECDCGIDEISCIINTLGERECTCGGDSLAVKSGEGEKCERCSCGLHSISCQMVHGQKKCNCKSGYVVKSISWGLDEECILPDLGKLPSPTSTWKILTYALIAAYAFITLVLLTIIFLKKGYKL